ncbi:protein-L-isoaspartate O-methyltransferase [Haloprofundus marisrubri]|uniref:protein-L-isoaspartate(D-aspartate) O-methyltransferase n=1 Tax=Haloprofundus marisrubri TaxID=1514971 RepID=A0A0W1RE16_9EURY|nr:protein-L-isoaspartate O-methyltransferase [Haloprofundus marisrubri]KTG10861.1 protein-L-isoaspartate O-methyltransferase [Haloprofundus marisrubri]
MDPAVLREDMVDGLEQALGERLDERVDVAMRTVPRHEYVDDHAYANKDTTEDGSRILAPSTVARLFSALDPAADDNVLVVGAGVGYTAAVAAELVGESNVQAIDISRRMVYYARQRLAQTGYQGVLVDCRDGANGYPEYAPFDRILLEAAAIRPPRALVDQLAPSGRLVFPMGGPQQTLVAVESGPDAAGPDGVVERFGPAEFAPMLVDGEQPDGLARNRTVREDREYNESGWHARTGWEQDWVDWDEHL